MPAEPTDAHVQALLERLQSLTTDTTTPARDGLAKTVRELRQALAASRKAERERYQCEARLRQQAEEQLRVERLRSEDALRQRADDRAEEGRRKDAWLAMLAHELRNPLTPIRNALHILQLRGNEEKTRTWAGDLLGRQVQHLTRLIDDLLDVSRINRGKIALQRERLDLAWLVRTVAADHRAALDEAGLRLELDVGPEPVWVVGDSTRLAQTLANLLSNAVKFTPRGGTVAVRLEADGERAVIRVQDTGAGIAPELLPHIFSSFVQGEQTLARPAGGLGLGLALVKGLVELHGGQVQAHSDGIGRGATFTIWVPLVHEPVRLAPETTAAPSGPRLRILVIEDHHDAAESLRRMLELRGHQVRVVYSGPAGIAAARLFPPDVVLCDLGLPGLNGFEVARALRHDPATAELRLIALSGYGTEADRLHCREAGFDLHLTKPVDPQELERVLATLPQHVLGGR